MRFLIVLGIVVFFGAIVLYPIEAAPCSLYTDTSPIRDKFGASWDVFKSSKPLLVSVDCQGPASATLTAGNGDASQIIYRQGWKWVQSQSEWAPITFSGSPYQSSSSWFTGSVSASVPSIEQGTNHVVAYVCTLVNGQWKCGCKDAACATGYWQLQAFDAGGGSNRIDVFTANISESNQAWVVHRPYSASNPLYGPVGEGSATPRWHIIQWHAQSELSGQTDHLGSTSDNTWQIESPRVGGTPQLRVKGVPQGGGSAFQLLSDTTGPRFMGCTSASELDLFMGPNPQEFLPASYPMGFIPMAERPSLGAAGTYRLAFGARIISGMHINDGTCAAPFNVYSGVVGIHLINARTNKHLQYQIISYDSRGTVAEGWYDSDGSDGYCGPNDDIQNAYGKPRLTAGGGAVAYDIDVESRLRHHIQNAPSSCWGSESKDMNDWKPLTYYIGSYINGKAQGEIEVLSSMLYVQ